MTRRTEFIPYRPKTVLNRHRRADHWLWVRYTAYLYKGCQHGCEFCYRLPCVQVRVAQTPLTKYTSSRRFQN